MTKKLEQICKQSGLTCEDFGYDGKCKRLPDLLKCSPQHIVYDDTKFKLIYFKASFDPRFVMLFRNEIESIRKWNSSINKVIVFIFNYKMNMWTTFDMNHINDKMFTCPKDGIDKFLFSNLEFKWRYPNEKFEIR